MELGLRSQSLGKQVTALGLKNDSRPLIYLGDGGLLKAEAQGNVFMEPEPCRGAALRYIIYT